MIQWRKSSRSGTNADGNCVELADLGTTIAIRDSKNPHAPHLALTRPEFAALTTRIKHDAPRRP
jgi:hypothetical protein